MPFFNIVGRADAKGDARLNRLHARIFDEADEGCWPIRCGRLVVLNRVIGLALRRVVPIACGVDKRFALARQAELGHQLVVECLYHAERPNARIDVIKAEKLLGHHPSPREARGMAFTRDDAWSLVCEFVQNPSLRRHMLAVETCMRAYARKFGEDEERWATIGLLHDFDWEIHPTAAEHPELGCRMLEERGWPTDVVRAIRGHATYLNVPRDTLMARALFACDELAGFISAVTYVRPNKKVSEVAVESVKKKFKDKRFAANVNREEIYQGAEELGVPLDEHIGFMLGAMTANAAELGL